MDRMREGEAQKIRLAGGVADLAGNHAEEIAHARL
jgi:hypothetical protein